MTGCVFTQRVPEGCPLTPREYEVLELAAIGGLQEQGIAHRLGIRKTTVRTHKTNAYRKLGASNGVRAVVMCIAAGWLDPAAQLNEWLGEAV